MIVLFMEVHSVWKHFFNITDFDWHVRTQHTTVYLNTGRVRVIKRPNKKVLHYVVEAAAGLKVHRLVFLDWHHRKADQVRTSHYVALELHEVWQSGLCMIVNFVAGYSDLFFSNWVFEVPWSHVAMFT